MKCQYCHEKDAVNTFLIAFPDGRQEIHLCEDCTKLARRYYEMAMRAGRGASGDAAGNRRVGSVLFPENTGADIRRRRQVNMLKAKLDLAVKEEHFEEAALIRDQIAAQEKDVYAI